jgi:hypothetical protein
MTRSFCIARVTASVAVIAAIAAPSVQKPVANRADESFVAAVTHLDVRMDKDLAADVPPSSAE